jgi:hypothetical protein
MDGGFEGRRHRTPIADGENGDLIMIAHVLTRDYRPQSHISQTLKDAELILAEAGIALVGPDNDSAAVIEAIRRPVATEVAI